jgi:alpha-beta hydrolase superfamily lysophospholipase
MQHTKRTIQSIDGLDLFWQTWTPDSAATAAMAIVHGFGEHSDRYMNAVNYFVPKGCAVYGFDLRGYGRSGGKRGHIDRWDDYVNDVKSFMDEVRQGTNGIPLFLWGHSLGGLIALDYAARCQDCLRGVITSGPLLGEVPVSPALVKISQVMSRVWPGFGMDIHLDATAVSRDPTVVQAYQKDTLVHSIATARFGTELNTARARVNQQAAQFKLPLLLMQGGADRLTPAASNRMYHDSVGSKDKQFVLYPDAYHELHNDLGAEHALADMFSWMQARY